MGWGAWLNVMVCDLFVFVRGLALLVCLRFKPSCLVMEQAFFVSVRLSPFLFLSGFYPFLS